MTTDERLASIDTQLAVLDQRLKTHTEADDHNFNRLAAQLDRIEGNVDALRIAQAARDAVEVTTKRNAGVVGGGTAASIVAIIEAVKYFVHR